MTPPDDPERYKNHRFPGEIISHGVWLYYRFPLSYRDVQGEQGDAGGNCKTSVEWPVLFTYHSNPEKLPYAPQTATRPV